MTEGDTERSDQTLWVFDVVLVALGTILTRDLLSRPLSIETGGILLLFWSGVFVYVAQSRLDWEIFDRG